jgi:hypothetical protein
VFWQRHHHNLPGPQRSVTHCGAWRTHGTTCTRFSSTALWLANPGGWPSLFHGCSSLSHNGTAGAPSLRFLQGWAAMLLIPFGSSCLAAWRVANISGASMTRVVLEFRQGKIRGCPRSRAFRDLGPQSRPDWDLIRRADEQFRSPTVACSGTLGTAVSPRSDRLRSPLDRR